MTIQWTDSTEGLDWEELSRLYEAAPLGKKEPAGLKISFGNSMFKCFAYDDGNLVAVGRALADGVDCSYICDVAVLPSHQGMGLGREVVSRLVKLSQNHRKIILYSVPGKEPFYKKLGFKRMKTALAIFKDQTMALQTGLVDET